MKIKVLPDEIASQIAAGEVIERPASVVKELIENSLDAGADQIEITIREAGRRLIEIADNGSGIPAGDLPLTVTRHATSKLSTAEDLVRIETLGFRGEALASISSVSQMTITSRHEEEEIGSRIEIAAGEVGAQEEIGTPAGTIIRVANLFYNVPARLKFLKTDRTERRHIKETVVRYALAYPGVRFTLTIDDQLSFQTTGSGEPREVLVAVYGLDVGKKMISVLAKEDGVEIRGFISPPGLTRSNRKEILFYINRRPVQDIALTKALTRAYHTMLMKGRYPLAVLFLEMEPEQVDVNVHPTKAEVRFQNKSQVFRAVERAVRRALLANTPVPEIGSPQGQRLWGGSSAARRSSLSAPSGGHTWSQVDPGGISAGDESVKMGGPQSPLEELSSPILRLVGQVAATYLIAEGPDGLYLIDQHAAHERVLFEKFRGKRGNQITSQNLLEPVSVEFSPAAAELLEEKLPLLKEIGFDVEPFGMNTFVVRAVPVLVADTDPRKALRAVVEDLEEDETPLEKNWEEKIIARICKQAAVKAGRVLAPEEQKALLTDLESCQSPRTCPHGRPTMIHLSVDLLERKFGRTGPR
ncbi:MAG: DNA mismatch repair endonuclease MutL [Anaerolineales bacterium]|nr:DNA mismatch repair endonuclease MutL [Anaerolineales bacterium]